MANFWQGLWAFGPRKPIRELFPQLKTRCNPVSVYNHHGCTHLCVLGGVESWLHFSPFPHKETNAKSKPDHLVGLFTQFFWNATVNALITTLKSGI